ncbi:MAG: hypothetical protein VKO39_01230 [Cyanobacteriota bacterium]|nr:hypothetical protein [Cyanobacteriota bacterium]
MSGTSFNREIPCRLITCLQWTPDGEICADDKSALLHRLMQGGHSWQKARVIDPGGPRHD